MQTAVQLEILREDCNIFIVSVAMSRRLGRLCGASVCWTTPSPTQRLCAHPDINSELIDP